MSFLNPEYFWFLLLLLPLFIKGDYRNFRFVVYGYMMTYVLIVIALSRPVIEQEPIQTKQNLNDIVIAVDLSYSMQATDILPTRLGHAKEVLKELVMAQNQTRFGVLGFTTNAIVLSPLTQDRELLLHLYSALDEKFILTRGSSVLPALKLARKMSNSKSLSVVLLTDGADEFSYEDEARYAKDNNMIVNIFMLATKMGGTLSLENGDLLKDELGDIVVSRENDAVKEIADKSGGVYTSSFGDLLDALQDQRQDDKLSKTTVMQNMELFYYFIFLAIITFLISITTLRKYVLSFLLIFGISLSASENYDNFQAATKFYKEGEYDNAVSLYESVKSSDAQTKAIIFYNIGNTYVRLQEFKKARVAYLKSLTLMYTKEADENLNYIKGADDKTQMSTGQQKSKKKSEMAKKMNSSKKKKQGGGSNMKVDARSGSGDDGGKKAKAKDSLNLNSSKAKLSSKQYELINKRRSNEKQPW